MTRLTTTPAIAIAELRDLLRFVTRMIKAQATAGGRGTSQVRSKIGFMGWSCRTGIDQRRGSAAETEAKAGERRRNTVANT